MTNIIDKYPEFDSYFRESDPLPVFIKIMATILFIRQKLNYKVETTEIFYNHIHKIKNDFFENVLDDDLPALLEMFVNVGCNYINISNVALLEADYETVEEFIPVKI